jgi:hypothetical protein
VSNDEPSFASTDSQCFIQTTIDNSKLVSPFSALHQKYFPGTLAYFHYKSVQSFGFLPVVVSMSLLKDENLVRRLQLWNLLSISVNEDDNSSRSRVQQCAALPAPINHQPPASFESLHLRIRALTFDRPLSLKRLLDSLRVAQYNYTPYSGTTVMKSLKITYEISIDRASDVDSKSLTKSPQELEAENAELAKAQTESTQIAKEFCDVVKSKEFASAPISDMTIEFDCQTIMQSQHQGLVGQWVNSWNPPDDNSEILLVLEDDCSVSPVYFTYMFHLLDRYYFHSYDPNMFMISLQSQYTILGESSDYAYGKRTPQTVLANFLTNYDNSSNLNTNNNNHHPPQPTEYYRYQLVGTWGSVMFPSHWRHFQSWLRAIQFDYTKGEALTQTPCVPLMLSNQWWSTRRHGVWSQWIIRYAYEFGYYSLYSNHANLRSVILNHREQGVNFKTTRGKTNPVLDTLDNELIARIYSPVSSSNRLPLFDFHFRHIQPQEIPLLPLRKSLQPSSQINQCLTMAEVKSKTKVALSKSKTKGN